MSAQLVTRTTAFAFCVSILLSPLGGHASDTQTHQEPIKIRWQINHYPKRFFYEAANKMNELLQVSTGGRVVVEAVAPESDTWEIEKKADYSRVGVRVGEYDMVQSYTFFLTEYEPRLHVFDLPYLFAGHDHFDRVVDGPLAEQLSGRLRNYGYEPLAFTYSGGRVGIPAKKQLRKPSDFAALKYRAWEHQVNLETHRLLGSTILNGHMLRRTKTFPLTAALDGGVAEAGDCEIIEFKQLEGIPGLHYNILDHRMLATVLLMNKKKFDSLSLKDQQSVKKAASEAARWERSQIIRAEEDQLTKMKEGGLSLVVPTDAEKKAFKNFFLPVHQMYDSLIGKKLLNDIKKLEKAEPSKGRVHAGP